MTTEFEMTKEDLAAFGRNGKILFVISGPDQDLKRAEEILKPLALCLKNPY
jgi:hypothetical protein